MTKMIDEMLIDKLLDRIEDAAIVRAAAEAGRTLATEKISDLKRRADDRTMTEAKWIERIKDEKAAKDKEIGELKQRYDATKAELRFCSKRVFRLYGVLIDLCDALQARKTPKTAKILKAKLSEARECLVQEKPF